LAVTITQKYSFFKVNIKYFASFYFPMAQAELKWLCPKCNRYEDGEKPPQTCSRCGSEEFYQILT